MTDKPEANQTEFTMSNLAYQIIGLFKDEPYDTATKMGACKVAAEIYSEVTARDFAIAIALKSLSGIKPL